MFGRTLELPDDWTAGDLHAVADALYAPDDERADPRAWTWPVRVNVGALRGALRDVADQLERQS